MKQSLFITLITVVSFGISSGIYWYLGQQPKGTIMHTVNEGGPLVIVLIMVALMLVAFVIERFLSLAKAKGSSSVQVFFKRFIILVQSGDWDAALASCDKQRGSTANVLRAGIEEFRKVERDEGLDSDKKIQAVQSGIEEANALEGPLLERNLIAMSTIASIATMVGLLGTTIGMIRAFAATGNVEGGVIDASQLAVGISEALVNTAGGLFSGILGIFFYNFFVNKVDTFNYVTDEASFETIQVLKTRLASKKAA
ncbi:MAG: MotA/TolQ/ExbB proton channel family protein [Candidatus Zixiibacteriota bacterium]